MIDMIIDIIMGIWQILASLEGFIVAVFGLIWRIYVYIEKKRKEELDDSESRKRYHEQFNYLLSANRFDYASYLQSVLGKVDNLFGSRAFSVKSYEVCLLWAFIYPLILGFLFLGLYT